MVKYKKLKWKCCNCDCEIDDFDSVWEHINGFSHVMRIDNPKLTIVNGMSTDSVMGITDDEYLFLANCNKTEFNNFFVWRDNDL